MEDFDDPLDLDGGGEFGAFEASILDEETNRKKGSVTAIMAAVLFFWCLVPLRCCPYGVLQNFLHREKMKCG